MTLTKIAFVSLLIVFNLVTNAQDISKYLDDGGFSTGSKILKVSIDPLNGILPVLFEHRLNKKMSLEWGAGLVSIQRQNWRYSANPLPIASSGTGYMATGALKLYLHSFPERSYFALRTGLSKMSGKLFTDAASMNFGYQRPVVGKWMIDLEIGLGLRIFEYTTMYGAIAYTDKDTRLTIPVSIKTGYMF
jgi:hypothetical protein